MPQKIGRRWNRTEAFAHFGVRLKNPRWSWSGISDDGRTVVLTLWEDELRREEGKVVADFYRHPRLSQWQAHLGNRERIRNLQWARDHCSGRFGIVLLKARDVEAVPRQIAEARPAEALVMRLTDLNEQTGEFRAESFQAEGA